MTTEPPLPVAVRGSALLRDAVLNKGTAFTESERHALGLEGLLPPAVETLAQQVARVHLEYDTKATPLDRHIAHEVLMATKEFRMGAALMFDRPGPRQVIVERLDFEHPSRGQYLKRNRQFVSGVEPLTQVVTASADDSSLREDVIVRADVITEVLQGAPDPEAPYFRVPRVIEK